MNKNIEVLEEVVDLLESGKRKFYNLVNQNDFRIEEINSYLRELSKREDDDFKVFSPRNVENMHREQIEADTSEKKKYEEENVEYNKKIESLKVLIDKVNVVIGNLQIEEEKRQIRDNDEKENLSENILDVDDNIEKEHFIENDIESECFSGNIFAEDDVNRKDIVVENNIEVNLGVGENNNTNSDIIVTDEENYKIEIQKLINENKAKEKYIAHQILNCVSLITPDAERAKIELAALARKMIEH